MRPNGNPEGVSIVVPVHNEEDTLDRSLDSIRRQNVQEIVIVLDRCNDNSEKIAAKHADEDPRIRVFSLDEHKNEINYSAETVNFAISKAREDVICLAEADTILGTNYVTTLLPYLRSPVASVSGRLVPIHKKHMYSLETTSGTGRLFLRKTWNDVGGFHDILASDTSFDLELIKRNWEVRVIDKAVLYDIRSYTLKHLALRAVKRGKGRRQLGQSFLFMLGHGLYFLTKSPFGIVELIANFAGYLSTNRKRAEENMRRYEAKRIQELARGLMRRARG